MELRLLGPFEVADGDRTLVIGGGRQRKLLAILALRANEFVGSERLIEELWGEQPPETAAKALQGYISQLRKTLGHEVLLTRPGGYILQVAPGQLDVHRFEQLVDEARDAEPREAAEKLREALALWRGPALADFAYDDFARTEIARLEERRLIVLEQRIDADLALGRHAALVGELAALVAQEPLSERPQAQLMLALYRSGRQAEALEVYQQARRTFREDLGLEPSEELQQLQRAILAHDPALGPAARTVWPRARRVIARPHVLGALGAILLAGAIGVATLLLLRDPGIARAEADSVAFLDPTSGELVGQTPVRRTAHLGFGGDSLWSMTGGGTLERIDLESHEVTQTLGVGVNPGGLAVGHGSVWITDADSPTLLRVDARYGSVDKIAFPPESGGAGGVSVGAGSVWVAQGGSRVLRIEPRTGRVVRRFDVPHASDVVLGDGKAWLVSGGTGIVRRVDPATNQITGSVRVHPEICCVAVGGGFVWIVTSDTRTVWKFSGLANPKTPLASVKLAGAGDGLAYGDGALWATTGSAGTVTRIDPRTEAPKTFTVGHDTGAVAVDGGHVAVGVGLSAADATAGLRGRIAHFISDTDWLSDTDPAIATSPWQWQLEYATCAKLMNYPDAPAPAGWRVAPEVAAGQPVVSADGRRYSFRIRPDFRFSPPSNEPVTAETFRSTIERALSPRFGRKAPAAAFASDIAGVDAYRAGRAQHVAGISAQGDTLTIRLERPVEDLAARMALPYFCAVPLRTPIVPNGLEKPIPAAGPYYLATHVEGVVAVVKRNPNYPGARPQRLDAIVYRRPDVPADAVSQIERGEADHLGEYDLLPASPLVASGQIADRYGPPHRQGAPRLFVSPLLAIDYLAFNARGPLFSDPRLRRAVNFALDRRAIADTYGWPPADQFLPPGMPGYRGAHIYPLGRPDLARARTLAGGRGGRAVLHVCDVPYCTQWARIIRSSLAAIGIEVVVRVSAEPYARAAAEGGDMLLTRMSAAFPSYYQDPVTFLENALALPRSRTRLRGEVTASCPVCGVPRGWFNTGRFERKLDRIRRLDGPDREGAAGALDLEIARAAPGAVLVSETFSQLFSARMGCQTFQPLYFGVDIAALCMREGD